MHPLRSCVASLEWDNLVKTKCEHFPKERGIIMSVCCCLVFTAFKEWRTWRKGVCLCCTPQPGPGVHPLFLLRNKLAVGWMWKPEPLLLPACFCIQHAALIGQSIEATKPQKSILITLAPERLQGGELLLLRTTESKEYEAEGCVQLTCRAVRDRVMAGLDLWSDPRRRSLHDWGHNLGYTRNRVAPVGEWFISGFWK